MALDAAAPEVAGHGEYEWVVVDASALIASGGASKLRHVGRRLATVPQALAEVRDFASRTALTNQMAAFQIETLTPEEASVRHVARFAKATGDIGILSVTDMQLLALAHDLERKTQPDRRMPETPAPPTVLRPGAKNLSERPLPGWGQVKNPQEWEEEPATPSSQPDQRANLRPAAPQGAPIEEVNASAAESPVAAEPSVSMSDAGASADVQDDDGWEKPVSRSTRIRHMKREARHQAQRDADEAQLQRDLERINASQEASEPAACTSEHDDDAFSEDERVNGSPAVACATADFAMQNVLLQMGIGLITLDGRRVQQLARWALKCQACQTVTRDVQRVFCPKCGNGGTLFRVSVNIDESGVVHYGGRKRYNLRGTRYSLPKPVGGREGNALNPVLREDQLPKTRKPLKKAADPFDVTAVEDAFSKAHCTTAKLQARHRGEFDMFSKRNPNERRASRSKR
eukprot:jgi/Chlat1/8621/Chrsp86S08009